VFLTILATAMIGFTVVQLSFMTVQFSGVRDRYRLRDGELAAFGEGSREDAARSSGR